MSKIARYAGNLLAFGSNAQGLERTVFGGTAQADDLTSQVTNAFLRGWGIVGPSENPSLEDFNAAFYTLSQLISYQHQMGVPEWDAKQEYYLGSCCCYGGELYLSLTDNNTGNKPPSDKWNTVLNVKNAIAKLGLGTASLRNIGAETGAVPPQIPDMSYFSKSAGSGMPSWQMLPSKTLLQWGSLEGSSRYNLTFPTSFSSATSFTIVAVCNTTFSTAPSGAAFCGVSNFTRTGCSIVCTGYSSGAFADVIKTVHWYAIGL